MLNNLKFVKMWEAANTYVFDMDPGTILPLLETVPKISSFADKDWLYFYEKGIGAAYYEQSGMEKAKRAGLNDFLNEDFQKRYFDGAKSKIDLGKKFIEKIDAINIHNVSITELGKLISEGGFINTNIFGYSLSCLPQYILGIEEKVQQELARYISPDLVIETFTLLSTSTKRTTIKQEEIDWINILLEEKSPLQSLSFDEKLNNHLKKYRTLHSADGGRVWTEEYLLTKFNNEVTSIDDLKLKLQSIEDLSNKTNSEKELMIKKFKIPTEIVECCNLLAEIGHLRLEMRISGWIPVQIYLEFLAEEVAKRAAYDFKKIKFARLDEVIGITKGILIDKNILEKRSERFLIAILDRNVTIYAAEQAQEKFDELVQDTNDSSLMELKGNVAMRGKIIGRVVLFKWTDDISKKVSEMKEDSILVTGQTRPQLMPLLVKAKAIVTDEGGITSHAAIVSRELKIPCIIGTKIATKVFKDGDVVEVDANVGIVKLIK